MGRSTRTGEVLVALKVAEVGVGGPIDRTNFGETDVGDPGDEFLESNFRRALLLPNVDTSMTEMLEAGQRMEHPVHVFQKIKLLVRCVHTSTYRRGSWRRLLCQDIGVYPRPRIRHLWSELGIVGAQLRQQRRGSPRAEVDRDFRADDVRNPRLRQEAGSAHRGRSRNRRLARSRAVRAPAVLGSVKIVLIEETDPDQIVRGNSRRHRAARSRCSRPMKWLWRARRFPVLQFSFAARRMPTRQLSAAGPPRHRAYVNSR